MITRYPDSYLVGRVACDAKWSEYKVQWKQLYLIDGKISYEYHANIRQPLYLLCDSS